MPSEVHEMPLELIRDQPELVPELLERYCDISIPRAGPITVGSEACNLIKPLAAVKDRTILIGPPNRPKFGIIVEVQRRRSRTKKLTWPLYLAVLRYSKKCHALLLVICQDTRTAKRLSQPIRTGHPNWDLSPVTLALDTLPPVTDPGQARKAPGLSILSTPTHADGPHAQDVLTAYAAAIDACDLDRGRRYHDFTQSQLSAAAQQMLEAIVPEQGYKWRSTFAIEHRCAGEATAVLEVLDARDIEVTPQQRDWITQCTDESTLRTWIRRAVTAETADEVFG